MGTSQAPRYGTEFYPHKRERAREKFEQTLFKEKPEYRELADQYAKYLSGR